MSPTQQKTNNSFWVVYLVSHTAKDKQSLLGVAALNIEWDPVTTAFNGEPSQVFTPETLVVEPDNFTSGFRFKNFIYATSNVDFRSGFFKVNINMHCIFSYDLQISLDLRI